MFSLIFYQFQPDVDYESVALKKECNICLCESTYNLLKQFAKETFYKILTCLDTSFVKKKKLKEKKKSKTNKTKEKAKYLKAIIKELMVFYLKT